MSKKKQTEPHRRFRHYHIPEIPELEAVTIVAEEIVPESNSGSTLWRVSWALCNPEDNFSRAIGRKVAIESMDKRGIAIHVDNGDNPIDSGIKTLLTSNSLNGDREIQRLRGAMSYLYTEEQRDTLGPYYRCLAIAHEKVSAIKAFLHKFGK